VVKAVVKEALHASGPLPEPFAELLATIASKGGMTAEEAARALFLPRTTARFRLERLERQGLLRSAPAPRRPGQRGRSAKVYSLSRDELVLSFPPRSYRFLSLLMAQVLEEAGLSPEEARASARAFGQRLAEERSQDLRPRFASRRRRKGAFGEAVGAALLILEELGYMGTLERSAPDLAVVTAHNCPFRGVLGSYPGLICALDMGLWEGVAEGAYSGQVRVEVESCQAEGASCCRVLLRPEGR
jgi:predicted ArsR family transcriptional regulator